MRIDLDGPHSHPKPEDPKALERFQMARAQNNSARIAVWSECRHDLALHQDILGLSQACVCGFYRFPWQALSAVRWPGTTTTERDSRLPINLRRFVERQMPPMGQQSFAKTSRTCQVEGKMYRDFDEVIARHMERWRMGTDVNGYFIVGHGDRMTI